jgi:pimeloyl-ACP methyl ester carboxylesterase
MNKWQSSNVEGNGIHLHITRTGRNKPPLVLAHGVTDDGLCWSPVAEALAADYDVIMVDARGHGQSDAPESGYDLVTLVNDLHGVIQALGLNKPLVMGHSLGAVTTLVMAALYPDLPRAIVLEDPPGWWVKLPASESLQRANGFREWATRLKSMTRQQIFEEGRAQNPLWSDAELDPWADSKVSLNVNTIRNIFNSNHAAAIVWKKTLQRVSCPVLVVTADLSRGAALTPAGVEALRTLIPHLQVEHIPDAGHSIRREQFVHYMEVVRTFLANIPAA